MKYNEIKVKCYGTAESGPFAEMENGKRVYGLPAAAPDMLAALEWLTDATVDQGNATESEPAIIAARAAIAKARGEG